MILKGPHQKVNIVVRALIVRQDHLLLSHLVGGTWFPVGGRVEFGETLLEALYRETLEETGAPVLTHRLLYTNENFFTLSGRHFHEFGWFYLVEVDRPVTPEEGPHPDDPDLRLAWVPLSRLASIPLFPAFLRSLIPSDAARSFSQPLRHVVSHSTDSKEDHTVLFPGMPGA